MFVFRLRLLWMVVAVASTIWIGTLWTLAVRNGKTPEPLLMIGIGLLCGAGTAALTVLPGFMIYRYFYTQPPEFRAEAGEQPRMELPANHFLDGEARGGRLHVTDRRLVFVPHRYNVQLDGWSVPWSAVVGFSTAPPTFLFVQLAGGKRATLVVPEPDEVVRQLLALKSGTTNTPAA
jgi:hypothetical protein